LESSFGTKFAVEGDWLGSQSTTKVFEKGNNIKTIPKSSPIEWHFWRDVKQNLFTFIELTNNQTSTGNFSVDDAPTPNNINFQYNTGPYAGLMGYGIYQTYNTTPEKMIMAVATPGLPLRPVSFQTSQFVTVIQGKQRNTPHQVHLAFGTDTSTTLIVAWITPLTTKTSEVQYGTQSGNYMWQTFGTSWSYMYKHYSSGWIHKVSLTNLNPGVTYYYRVGDNFAGFSQEFTVRMPQDTNNKVTVTIYGDLNLGGAIGGNTTTWANSLDTIDYVYRQEQETSDFLLHVGDIAYCNGSQPCWDHFFQDVQPIASHMPYMVCFGNHDVYPEPFGYTNRFFMPGPYSPQVKDGDYFYSFDLGPVHFVGFSTELWFLPVNATVNVTQQMTWLQNDLKVANQPANRKVRPWILIFGHRPVYCSIQNYPDCDNRVALQLQRQMEPLLLQNGVDVAVFGHIHAMERSFPVTYDASICGNYSNPCGTVHIVNGAAGQPFLGPPFPKPEWSAYRTSTYGYARMTATLTSLKWDFVSKVNGSTIDTFTLGNPWPGESKDWTPGHRNKMKHRLS